MREWCQTNRRDCYFAYPSEEHLTLINSKPGLIDKDYPMSDTFALYQNRCTYGKYYRLDCLSG